MKDEVVCKSSAVKVYSKLVPPGSVAPIDSDAKLIVSPTMYPDPGFVIVIFVTDEVWADSTCVASVILATALVPVPPLTGTFNISVPPVLPVIFRLVPLEIEDNNWFAPPTNAPDVKVLPIELDASEKEPVTTRVTNNDCPPWAK